MIGDLTMNIQYLNNEPVIVFCDRYYRSTEKSRDAVTQIESANKILARPCITFGKGRESHAVARGIIDEAELTLLGHLIVPVLR